MPSRSRIDQRQRQLLLGPFDGLVALLFGLAQDAPALERVAHQRAFARGDAQVLIQNARRVAQQGIGQRVRADAAGQLVRAGAHDQRKAAVVQRRVCIGVAAGKRASDGMAEVRHEHQHQRGLCVQQVAEPVARAVGRINLYSVYIKRHVYNIVNRGIAAFLIRRCLICAFCSCNLVAFSIFNAYPVVSLCRGLCAGF